MALYILEAANLNCSYADMCSDVAGPSRSGPGNSFELSDRSNESIILIFPPLLAGILAAILNLNVTTTHILPSGRFTSSCIRPISLKRS